MLGTVISIALTPVKLPWWLYNGLWWAFDTRKPIHMNTRGAAARPQEGNAAPAAEATPVTGPAAAGAQDHAFQVIDSRRREQRPLRPRVLLMLGYLATLAASGLSGGISAILVNEGQITEPRAWMTWGWVTAAAAVVTLLMVRIAAGRIDRRRAAGLPSLGQRVKCAAAGSAGKVGSCCRNAAKGAAMGAGRTAVRASCRCVDRGAAWVRANEPAIKARAQAASIKARRVWNELKSPVQPASGGAARPSSERAA